jgi:hypothetical protein
MWMWWMPDQRPDASAWPGRVVLAVLDALLWPLAWIVAALRSPLPLGLVGQVVMALSLLFLITRIWKAITNNPRYFFTTGRWLLPMVALAAYGMVLKAFA